MLAAAFLLALGTGTAAAQAPAPAAGRPPAADSGGEVARFDWFSYQGDDSIYRVVHAGPDEYLNPILAGFHPDPTICREGDDYYLANSSFAYYPGVPLFTSRDLVHWTELRAILDRPSQLDLDSAGVSRGIFAPSLSCRPGELWMITTLVDRGGNFLVTTTDAKGPWSDPVWLGFDGIDPSLFFDADGRIYVVNNGPPPGTPLYPGHRAIWIQEYDSAARRMTGPRTLLVNGGVDLARHPIWIEAPHLFRKDGWYYLICAEGGTAEDHSEVVFRSRALLGPYLPGPIEPILTQRQLDPARPFPVWATGHAQFVETQRGQWWAVFLGVRPYEDFTFNTGRETYLLPVDWKGGWPVILTDDATVPYVVRKPDLPPDPRPGTPLSGNFTLRDEFDSTALSPVWSFLRTVREPFAETTSEPGWLTIHARADALDGPGQPAFVARRQQHAWATAATAMRYRARVAGDEAGIVAFQGSDAFYFLGVAAADGRPVIEVQRRSGAAGVAATTVVASTPLEASADSTLYLRIRARGGSYDFSYAYRPGAWVPLLTGADGTILSTKRAGGFVGTMLGLYACHPRR